MSNFSHLPVFTVFLRDAPFLPPPSPHPFSADFGLVSPANSSSSDSASLPLGLTRDTMVSISVLVAHHSVCSCFWTGTFLPLFSFLLVAKNFPLTFILGADEDRTKGGLKVVVWLLVPLNAELVRFWKFSRLVWAVVGVITTWIGSSLGEVFKGTTTIVLVLLASTAFGDSSGFLVLILKSVGLLSKGWRYFGCLTVLGLGSGLWARYMSRLGFGSGRFSCSCLEFSIESFSSEEWRVRRPFLNSLGHFLIMTSSGGFLPSSTVQASLTVCSNQGSLKSGTSSENCFFDGFLGLGDSVTMENWRKFVNLVLVIDMALKIRFVAYTSNASSPSARSTLTKAQNEPHVLRRPTLDIIYYWLLPTFL